MDVQIEKPTKLRVALEMTPDDWARMVSAMDPVGRRRTRSEMELLRQHGLILRKSLGSHLPYVPAPEDGPADGLGEEE